MDQDDFSLASIMEEADDDDMTDDDEYMESNGIIVQNPLSPSTGHDIKTFGDLVQDIMSRSTGDDEDMKKYANLLQDTESPLDLTEQELFLFTQGYPLDDEKAMDHDDKKSDPVHSISDCSTSDEEDWKETETGSLKKRKYWSSTLTQNGISLSKRPSLPRDVSKNYVTYKKRSFMNNNRLLEVGQTFRYSIKGTPCFVRVARFCMEIKRRFDCAYCDVVYIDIQDTFLESKLAKALIKSETWLAVNHSKDKMNWKQRSDVYVPLAKLGEEITVDREPKWTYEINRKPGTHGEGYEACFTYSDDDEVPHRAKPERTYPNVLDLFAGAGGAALGFAKAGMCVKYAVDNSPAAIATLERNRSHLQIAGHDEEMVTFEEPVSVFLDRSEKRELDYPEPQDIDHIHASPPCQGFSTANVKGGKNDARNNEKSLQFMNAIELFQPTTASFENVTGMLRSKHRGYAQKIVSTLLLKKYQVRISITNSWDYGDPQKRCRLWLFASRPNVELPDVPPPVKEKRRLREALGPLSRVLPTRGGGRVRVDGVIVLDHCIEETKLKKNCEHLSQTVGGAPTILCQRNIKHHFLNRCITVRERATIQSFPLTYKFSGTSRQQKQLIGNAVPVNFAWAVAQSFAKSYRLHLADI